MLEFESRREGETLMERLGEKLAFLMFFITVMNVSVSPYPFLIALAYLIHEAGHLIFARLTGARVEGIGGSLFRLKIKYECMGISYGKEALVCLGGAMLNFVFAVIFAAPVFDFSEKAQFFVLCNTSLGVMNLYPVSVLDGGNAIRCLSYVLFSSELAEKIILCISFIFTFFLWLLTTYLQLIFSADVSVFLISIVLIIEFCFSLRCSQ